MRKKMMFFAACFFLLHLVTFAYTPSATAITIGSFTFDDNLFGNTLIESDGGAFSQTHYLILSTAFPYAYPGNPAFLTGANFDTGIVNFGSIGSAPLNPPVDYTIYYNTSILNNTGPDIGVVTVSGGDFSDDSHNIQLAVSTDGITFTNYGLYPQTSAGTNTFVTKTYKNPGIGAVTGVLWVYPVDLDSYGLAAGASIEAIRITYDRNATPFAEMDLIRVAGFEGNAGGPVTPPVTPPGNTVPEPSTFLLLGAGLAGVGLMRRKLRK